MIAHAAQQETAKATFASLGLGKAIPPHEGHEKVLCEILGIGFRAAGASQKGMNRTPVIPTKFIEGITAFWPG